MFDTSAFKMDFNKLLQSHYNEVVGKQVQRSSKPTPKLLGQNRRLYERRHAGIFGLSRLRSVER